MVSYETSGKFLYDLESSRVGSVWSVDAEQLGIATNRSKHIGELLVDPTDGFHNCLRLNSEKEGKVQTSALVESVTVPAGRFVACHTTDYLNDGTVKETWYAAEPRLYGQVKTVYKDRLGMPVSSSRLISFRNP